MASSSATRSALLGLALRPSAPRLQTSHRTALTRPAASIPLSQLARRAEVRWNSGGSGSGRPTEAEAERSRGIAAEDGAVHRTHQTQRSADGPSPPPSDLPASPPSGSSPPPSASASDPITQLTHRLQSARTAVASHLVALPPRLSTKLNDLNTKWNAYTGFESITALKHAVVELEASLGATRRALSAAKARYLAAVATRSASQRATNDLLSRRAGWSEADLSEYTRLLRSEHEQAKEEEAAERELEERERDVQARFDALMKGVMRRYHEEQIWSDRVRSVSTYGSLAVVGLNAVLFILAILIVEPYKRKRLAETFETRLLQGEEQGRQLVQQTIHALDDKVERLLQNFEAATAAASQRGSMWDGPVGVGVGVGVGGTVASVPMEGEGSEGVARVDELAGGELEMVFDREREEEVGAAAPTVVDGATGQPEQQQRREEQHRQQRRKAELAVASTAGVVAGAVLSLLVGACWGW